MYSNNQKWNLYVEFYDIEYSSTIHITYMQHTVVS